MADENRMRRGSSTVRLVVETGRPCAPPFEGRAHRRSDRIAEAVSVLHREPGSWFYQPRNRHGVFDAAILEALGRLGDPSRIRETARALAAAPPMPGAEARRWIRAWSEASPGTQREVAGLVRALSEAVEAHRRSHPGARWSAVCEALEQLLEMAEDARVADVAPGEAMPIAS